MNQIINDSIHAEQEVSTFGFFATNPLAMASTGGMNNNGWRRFRRTGIVPRVFFTYLQKSGVFKADAQIPAEGTAVGELLEFLKCYPYESEQVRSAGDYLFREILTTDIPSLTKTFAQEGHA